MLKYFDKVYIINLAKHTERRKAVAAELESVGWWNYEFIDAIAGKDLPKTTDMVKSGIVSKVFKDANGILTKNILACAMSHRKAQQTFLDDGIATCLIIEDDAQFLPVALKMMISGGMDALHEELHNKAWDIFMWGMPHTYVPNWGTSEGCNLLHDYKRYAPEWAAHAYQITRRGAMKLIESNSPVQYAADVNVECSDTEIYSASFSFISQKMGKWNRNVANELMDEFGKKIIHEGSKEYMPSTIDTDAGMKNSTQYYDTSDRSIQFLNKIKHVEIAGDCEIESVHWADHVNERGDTVLNWPHVTLKG